MCFFVSFLFLFLFFLSLFLFFFFFFSCVCQKVGFDSLTLNYQYFGVFFPESAEGYCIYPNYVLVPEFYTILLPPDVFSKCQISGQ